MYLLAGLRALDVSDAESAMRIQSPGLFHAKTIGNGLLE